MTKLSTNPFALTSFFGIKLKEEKNNGGLVFKSVLHNMSEKTFIPFIIVAFYQWSWCKQTLNQKHLIK